MSRTIPYGVEDLQKTDQYKNTTFPRKELPEAGDEHPAMLGLYVDAANMCKTVLRGILMSGIFL